MLIWYDERANKFCSFRVQMITEKGKEINYNKISHLGNPNVDRARLIYRGQIYSTYGR